jgi:hypothetical protein
MKQLLTAEVEGYDLTILVEVNNENFCFPTYFINNDEVNLNTIKPIFLKIFEVLLTEYCEPRNFKIYEAGVIDLRKKPKPTECLAK